MNHLGLTQKAYKLIKERLLSGEIKPGERIREDLLAEEISMSRTPVRESINQLTAEGFVYQIPRKGIFAIKFTYEELIDIIEIRVILESYAARKCCQNINNRQIIEFGEIFDKLKKALLNGDLVNASVYDGVFHRKLGEYSGNKRITKYVNEIEDLAVFARRMEVYSINHEYNELKSIEQHENILTAIMNRDEEMAAKAVEKNTKELLKRMRFEEAY